MGKAFSRRELGRGVRNTLVAATVARFAAGSPGGVRAAPAGQVPTLDPAAYDAFVPVVPKVGQFYSYTCEFDAAWIVLATFGVDVPFADMVTVVGHDTSVEPWYEETPAGFVIYGGDITTAFSGDYTANLLARAGRTAFKPLFEEYDLTASLIDSQEEVQAALDAGGLIWTKATVDFLPWQAATWITPSGEQIPTVLGNDHAVVINGYNQNGVVVSDPLGPTSTNWARQFQYEIPWDTFLAVWAAQSYNGLAIGPAEVASAASPAGNTISPSVPAVEITGGA